MSYDPNFDWQCFTYPGCPAYLKLASWHESRYCPAKRADGRPCGLSRRKVIREGEKPPFGLYVWDRDGKVSPCHPPS